MEGLTDPGFESGSPAWVFGPGAPDEGLILGGPIAVRVQAAAHSGTWSARLRRDNVGPDLPVYVGGFARQAGIPTIIGRSYFPRLWVNGDGRGATRLQLWTDSGLGLVLLGSIVTPPAGWSLWNLPGFVATSPSAAIQIQVFGTGSSFGTWYVDDVSFPIPDSVDLMREQIRQALLTKLRTISILNGFQTDVATVSEARPRADNLGDLPALYLRPAGAQTEDSPGVAYRHVKISAFWNVMAFVRDDDDTPDQVEALMEDVAKAVETDQTLGGLGFIQDDQGRAVMMTDEDPYDVPQEVGRGIQGYEMMIRTIYLAAQGQR